MSANPSENDWLMPETKLATIALRGDAYASVLDRHGLDFCCRGGRSLEEACASAGLEVYRVLAELSGEAARRSTSAAGAVEWHDRSLPELVDFIVDTHHAFTRDALARVVPLAAKVLGRHGDRHAELARVCASVAELAEEMEPHMAREERVLFPYIRALTSPEGAHVPPFVTVRNPVRVMMLEHDRAAELLEEISDATGGFTAPAGACASFRALYGALAELRLDLLRHVSLENNVLFPRAVAIEDQQRTRRQSHGSG
jgi:regulator of cell morphogenesis and NO signaling